MDKEGDKLLTFCAPTGEAVPVRRMCACNTASAKREAKRDK